MCNGNYDLGPDTQPAAPPVRAWAKHRPGLGGARRAVHVRRRVIGSTGRLDGRNGHLAKAVTATSGVAPAARSAARCARSGAASPRVRVGGSVEAGGWEGGFRCVSGAFRFSRSPFLVCTSDCVTVTMIWGPTPDRRPPVRAWAKPCPGGRGREGPGPVRPRVSASRHGFQLPDTASSFRPVSRCSKCPPCSFLWPHRPAIARGVVCTGHARRMGGEKIFRSSSLEDWNSGIFQSASGPWPGPESDTFLL